MDTVQEGNNIDPKLHKKSNPMKALLVLLNCILMSIGQVGGPLLLRIYYLHGGKRKWLNAWLLTAGFPILIFPLAICYAQRARGGGGGTASGAAAAAATTKLLVMPAKLVAGSAVLGILLGLDSYLYSFGLSYLPISVSSLLGSTQLAFTAIFALIVVKHKFTHYSVNAVVLMTFGSVILGFHMNGDRPAGESQGTYVLGFFMTIAAAALHGFIMPAVEYTHLKAGVGISFEVVLQFQFFVSMFATLFCTVPMIINKDFQAISKEAAEYGLGESKYYAVIVMAAVGMELLIIGSLGIIFCSTSLLGGLVSSFLVPVQQVFAVILLHERFNAEKGMALAMCLWGFASYFYGEYKMNYKKTAAKHEPEQAAV